VEPDPVRQALITTLHDMQGAMGLTSVSRDYDDLCRWLSAALRGLEDKLEQMQ
jgi:hypothetical protein